MARPRKFEVIASEVDFQRQHKTDAGFDLRVHHDITLYPGDPVLVGTHVRAAIPSNCVGIVAIRSSLGKRGITQANGIGVIDSGYRGEIKLNLVSYKNTQTIFAGERVAQLMVLPLQNVSVSFTDELPDSDRGTGGHGSTGKY